MPTKKSPPKKAPVPKAPFPKPVPLRPFVSALSVLVCHEKHEKRYFVTANDEDLFKHALDILRGRLMSDWYCAPEAKPEPLDYIKDDVQAMPKSFQEQAYEKLRKFDREMREWELDTALWTKIQEACSNADGRLAWSVLRELNDHEYERVSLEPANLKYDYTVKDEERDPVPDDD
jgi:hypothetical protein